MKKPSHRSNRATTSNTACTHEALSAHVNKWKRFRGRMRWCYPARRTTKVNSIACNCCGLQLLLCSPSLHPTAPSHCARHAARAHQRDEQTKICTHWHMRLFTPCIAHRKKKHTPLLPVQGRHGKAHNMHHAAHVRPTPTGGYNCVGKRGRSAAGTQSKAVTANRQPPELACCRCHRGRLRWAAQASSLESNWPVRVGANDDGEMGTGA